MTRRPRLLLRAGLALDLLAGSGAYVARARAVSTEIRQGRDAYATVCRRLTDNAEASGSPGTVAHLLAAADAELRRLAERYPRWYESYRKDPAAYPCGPQVPNTQVGSDR